MMPLLLLKFSVKRLEMKNGIFCIRNDHGGEFEICEFENFCNNFGIEHQFSSPRTPWQNGEVERKIGLFKK